MSSVRLQTIRPIVPAKNLLLSKLFYRDLGFKTTTLSPDLAEIGTCHSTFLLKDAWNVLWARHMTLHVSVDDLTNFWDRIMTLDLGMKYEIGHPEWLVEEVWGEPVGYLVDPSGVHLQFVNAEYARRPLAHDLA